MKKIALIILCLILTLLVTVMPSLLLSAEEKGNTVAVITQVIGKLEILNYGAKQWAKGKPGTFLYEGDSVRTGVGSKVVIIFSNGVEIKINENTQFDLRIAELGKVAEKIRMKKGQGTCSLRARADVEFSIKTPVAVAAVRGTKFDIKVADNGNTTVFVMEGIVGVKNDFGTVQVKENQITNVAGGSAPEPPKEASPEEIKSHTDWQQDIKIEEKTLKLKIKTEKGEEKTLRLKFRK